MGEPEVFERTGPPVTPAAVIEVLGRWNAAPFEGHPPGTVTLLRGTVTPGGFVYRFQVRPELPPLLIVNESTGELSGVLNQAPPRVDFDQLFPPAVPIVVGS